MNNTAISLLIQSIEYNNNNNYSTDHHHFVLCESCFWSATIFKSADKKKERIITTCPTCFNDHSISLIPLVKEEVYELSFRPKGGLEIKFSKLIKSPD